MYGRLAGPTLGPVVAALQAGPAHPLPQWAARESQIRSATTDNLVVITIPPVVVEAGHGGCAVTA